MLSAGLLDTGCAFLLCLGTTGRDASRSPHLYQPMTPGGPQTLERTKAAAMIGAHLKGSPEGGLLLKRFGGMSPSSLHVCPHPGLSLGCGPGAARP